MKRKRFVITLIIFLTFSSVGFLKAEAQLIRKVPSTKEKNFWQMFNSPVEVAYQTKTFPTDCYLLNEQFERIDIMVKDLSSGKEKNITGSIEAGEKIAFLFPLWSPDRNFLSFIGVKFKREVGSNGPLCAFFFNVYIADATSFTARKVHSFSFDQFGIPSYRYNAPVALSGGSFKWSRDSKKLLIHVDDPTGVKEYTQAPTPTKFLLLSIHSEGEPLELSYDDVNAKAGDFVSKITNDSPDGKYTLVETYQRCKVIRHGDEITLFGIGGGGFKQSCKGEDAVYVQDKKSKKKIKIFLGSIGLSQWTPDSEAVVFASEGTIFVVNRKGEGVGFLGVNPAVR